MGTVKPFNQIKEGDRVRVNSPGCLGVYGWTRGWKTVSRCFDGFITVRVSHREAIIKPHEIMDVKEG